MIIVLSGVNQFALFEKLNDLKTAFINEYSESGVEQYQAQQLDVDMLGSIVTAVSLFSSKRFVVIKELSTNKVLADRLFDLMPSISDDVSLVLVEGQLDKRTAFYKSLKKETDVYEFGNLDEPALAAWAQEYVKNSKGTLSLADAQLLVRYVGVDQLRLKNELDKLLAYNLLVTQESINLLVERRSEDTIFQLLESALSGKTEHALRILAGLESAHEDPYQVVNMLIWQANILAVAGSGAERSDTELAKSAKINPYVAKKTKQLAAKLSKQKLFSILDTIANLDVRLKTATTQPWRQLEVAIASL